MSSLTTPDGEDDDLVEIAETPLPPLKSVFGCPNLELCIVNEWTENVFSTYSQRFGAKGSE